MITLPKVELKHPKPQPHNFFIWGETMSGKSYFASFFPNPLVLNTDGNSEQGQAPAIQIRNIRDERGNLIQNSIEQVVDIITALQNQQNLPEDKRFKTIIIDVIDDITVMFEQAICLSHHVNSIGEIPYGGGYGMLQSVFQQFVMDLKALPLDVIFISREVSNVDMKTGEVTYEASLKDKYYNVVNGNCDLVIRTSREGYGQNISYFRDIKAVRTKYSPKDITNKKILKLLSSCQGMFSKEDLKNMEDK